MNTRPLLCLVTPALADANNGNWQTAQRWARLLSGHYRVRLAKTWTGASAEDRADQGLLALHARRSADALAAWAQQRPGQPLALALTGTDLYRDILSDASAQRSIRLAQALIVLQELGPMALPADLRGRCHVVLQSSTRRKTLPKTTAHLRALMVGHLREEKSPETYFEAARLLRPDEGIRLDHIGRALEPSLGAAAEATMAACAHYRWLGGLSHAATRGRIQRAHLLVHASRMEGGAHVIMEAALSGTPVLASRIDGNVGMLGADYGGYFEPGDAHGLARLLRLCRKGISQPDGLLAQLHSQCDQRAGLFEPAAEKSALLRALAGLPWPERPDRE